MTMPATMPSTTSPGPRPAEPVLPSADLATAHTLLNCLLRELPETESAPVLGGYVHLPLRRTAVQLRCAVRRSSRLGAHRLTGPAMQLVNGAWQVLTWRRLAELIDAELSALTGEPNEEFLGQVAQSRDTVAAALAGARPLATAEPWGAYVASEQSLLYGHRFHPSPKTHGDDLAVWRMYAPEAGASFPLRMLAVREELLLHQQADPTSVDVVDQLAETPSGYRLLPAHPWQYHLLRDHPDLRAALRSGDLLDLGLGRTTFYPTSSVRTVYDGNAFLKFSLNLRITNCLRKNADYELIGAVTLTRLLSPALDDLAARFPGADLLREPAFRSVAPPGGGSRSLLEGLGVIVREGLSARQRPGTTALLAGAVADHHPTGPAHLSVLLAGADRHAAVSWWDRYLRLLVPPVLAAYFDHGIVLEPHLQNVLVCVDDEGTPVQVLFRDLEGVKLLPAHHAAALADFPPEVAGPLTYDADRGWDRVVYCLLVNHIAEMLAALADLHPSIEPALWTQVRGVLAEYAERHGAAPRLKELLTGARLPAKQNLLTRWARAADRRAEYVRLLSPLAAHGSFPADGMPASRSTVGAGHGGGR